MNKILWAIIIVVNLLLAQNAVAQRRNASTSVSAQKEEAVLTAINALIPKKAGQDRILEDRARQIVQQQLTGEQFSVRIETELDPAKLRAAMGERSEFRLQNANKNLSNRELGKAFADSITKDTVLQYYKSTKLDLVFEGSVPKNLEPIITRALVKGLNLRPDRGDVINIKNERDPVQSSALARPPSELASKSAGTSAPFFERVKHAVEGIELFATLLPMGLLALTVLTVLTLRAIASSNKRAERLAASVHSLALAVKEVATSKHPKAAGSFASLSASPESGASQSDDSVAGAQNDENIEVARQEAEAALSLMQKHPYPMLSALKDWLSDEHDIEMFVAFSDAVGVDKARLLWSKFPRTEIEALSKVTPKPVPKAQAYATVLQLYRRVSCDLASKPPFFENLQLDFLVSTTDKELASVLDRCDLETAACCLLFVSPKRAAALYALIETHSPRDLMSVLGTKANLTEDEAERRAELVKIQSQTIVQPTGFALSSHLAVLLEMSTDDRKTAISEVLETDDKLSQEVRSRVVTFDDVMRLDRETLGELLLPLEPEQLAALFSTITTAQSTRISSLLSQNVVAAIREEVARHNKKSASKRRATVLGQRLQTAIIARVKQMLSEGLIVLPAISRQNSQNTNDLADSFEREAS